MNIKVLGIDIAKNIFQIHGVDSVGKKVVNKAIKRDKLLEFIAQLPQCLIGMEACGGSNYWGQKFTSLGYEVKLISPQFVKPYVKSNKNDKKIEEICNDKKFGGEYMGFKCGIVGLPNVGKSTIFNALTKASVAAANYPFCTIEPNVGIVPVPDTRLDKIAAIIHPKQILPAVVEFVDIAGLVKGAAQGEGLGNQFLAHIRETQAIAHVVRCFVNPDIAHVAGTIDPASDMEIINTELILADLDTVDKAIQKAGKTSKGGDKQALADKVILEEMKNHLGKGCPLRTFSFADNEIPQIVKQLHFITIKPVLYLANVDESGFTNNPYLDAAHKIADAEGAPIVCISAALEAEIAQLKDEDKLEFLTSLGLEEAGLNRLIRAGYGLLGLQTYFTAGVKEVRAWTIARNTKAPQAAGVIHGDFEKGFIRAEVIAYDDFITYHGEAGAREVGKLHVEGKEYVVCDGDVMHFRFNV